MDWIQDWSEKRWQEERDKIKRLEAKLERFKEIDKRDKILTDSDKIADRIYINLFGDPLKPKIKSPIDYNNELNSKANWKIPSLKNSFDFNKYDSFSLKAYTPKKNKTSDLGYLDPLENKYPLYSKMVSKGVFSSYYKYPSDDFERKYPGAIKTSQENDAFMTKWGASKERRDYLKSTEPTRIFETYKVQREDGSYSKMNLEVLNYRDRGRMLKGGL
jgi:hypothetical protein